MFFFHDVLFVWALMLYLVSLCVLSFSVSERYNMNIQGVALKRLALKGLLLSRLLRFLEILLFILTRGPSQV